MRLVVRLAMCGRGRFIVALTAAALLAGAAFAAHAADLAATVEWARKTALTTPVSGVIAAVHADVGAAVKKGSVLLALDPQPFAADVKRAQAQVTQARIALIEAKRDREQADELFQRTVLSTVERDNAHNRFARAEALLAQAQAELTQAQYRLRHSELRAPFDGWVAARNAEPGQAVAATLEPPVLFVLVGRGEYVARVQVPAAELGDYRIGQAASVQAGGKRYRATLKSIGFEPVKNADRLYELAYVFTADDAVLHPGQPATVGPP